MTKDDTLDQILEHLKNLDRRDRLRTWGGVFRSILGLIPIVIFIYSMWYFYQHGDEVLEKIARQAAIQAAEVTKQGTEGILQQLQDSFRAE